MGGWLVFLARALIAKRAQIINYARHTLLGHRFDLDLSHQHTIAEGEARGTQQISWDKFAARISLPPE